MLLAANFPMCKYCYFVFSWKYIPKYEYVELLSK
jgi:hypothetical protein